MAELVVLELLVLQHHQPIRALAVLAALVVPAHFGRLLGLQYSTQVVAVVAVDKETVLPVEVVVDPAAVE